MAGGSLEGALPSGRSGGEPWRPLSSMLPLGGPHSPSVRLTDVVTHERPGRRRDAGRREARRPRRVRLQPLSVCPPPCEKELVRVAHEAIDRRLRRDRDQLERRRRVPRRTAPRRWRASRRTRPGGFPFPVRRVARRRARVPRRGARPISFSSMRPQARLSRSVRRDSRPSNGRPVTGRDLRAALDAVLSGKKPLADQKPSVGCNIKWA